MDKNIKIRIHKIIKHKNKIKNLKILHLIDQYEQNVITIDILYSKLLENIINTEYKDIIKTPKVLIEIHAGTGGDDARELAEILFLSYQKFLANNKVKIIDHGYDSGMPGIGTGIITAEIPLYAIQGENGIHRIVRVNKGKKQTSFISVSIYPILPKTNIIIDPKDLKIKTCRSSGAGGQHVNKTESAVSITHLPSKITIRCENERSQHDNKETAMSLLYTKLQQKQKLEEQKKQNILSKLNISWGNHFRNYSFYAPRLIQDNRLNIKITEKKTIDKVLNDGYFEIFTQPYILEYYLEEILAVQ